MSNFSPDNPHHRFTKRFIKTAHWAILNWTVVFSGLALYSGLNALALVVVARQVAPIEYGQYLASFALASFLVIIPGFGMDAWMLTQQSESKESSTVLWVSSMRTRASLLLLWILAMIPLGMVLPQSTYPPELLYPTIIGVAFDSLILLSFSALRIRGEHRIVTIFQAASGSSLLALTLILPLEDGQIALFAIARSSLSLIVLLFIVIYMGRDFLGNRTELFRNRRIIKSSQTFLWSELASSVYIKADITIISLVIGPIGTSAYGPAVTILQASFLFLGALFYFFVPILSKAFNVNRHDYVRQNKIHLIIQIAMGTFISIMLFLLAKPIINLIFTEEYSRSIEVLRLLSPIPFFRSINFALAAFLMSAQKQKSRTRVQLTVALFNVTGNALVIVPFGIFGVAIIYVFSELFLAAGYTILVRDLQKQLHPG